MKARLSIKLRQKISSEHIRENQKPRLHRD